MKRLALLAIFALALPLRADCTAKTSLKTALETANDWMADNPRTVIHECFLPFLAGREEELDGASFAQREEFLYAVVTRTRAFALTEPTRPHYFKVITQAGRKYFDLQREASVPEAHAQKVLLAWSEVELLSNRLDPMLDRYEEAAQQPSSISRDGVAQWESVLRCASDSKCELSKFGGVARGEYGTNPVVQESLRELRTAGDPSGVLARWQRFYAFVASQPALTRTAQTVAALLRRNP